mmetsp:Transcript_946/g.2312  ORF Transcript_946/g.2312 Transcript_946/m.2312 type:complete len:262 (-) Transcript_946:819-1604(-)
MAVSLSSSVLSSISSSSSSFSASVCCIWFSSFLIFFFFCGAILSRAFSISSLCFSWLRRCVILVSVSLIMTICARASSSLASMIASSLVSQCSTQSLPSLSSTPRKSHPYSSSSSTMRMSPESTAECATVWPMSFTTSSLLPCSSSTLRHRWYPLRAAKWTGVSPLYVANISYAGSPGLPRCEVAVVCTFGSASPWLQSISIASLCMPSDAMCRGVHPSLLVMSTSAPPRISFSISFVYPLRAATCRAVSPPLSFALTRAP